MTDQEVIDRQVAEWNAEIARLADLVTAATTGDGGQKLICHDGKWVARRSTAAHTDWKQHALLW